MSILIFILLIIIIILIWKIVKLSQTQEIQIQSQYDQKMYEEQQRLEQGIARARANADIQIERECRRANEQKAFVDDLIQRENQRAESQKLYVNKQIEQLNERLETLKQKQYEVYIEGMQDYNMQAAALRMTKENEIKAIMTNLDDLHAKQDIVNQEIQRKKEVEENETFYKVGISEADAHDIKVLESIRSELTKQSHLDKMIYDNYISKPVLEMVKRVLKGESPSGIYKITRLKTGEIYIGKSTNIKDRWKQHAATAFNCGTIAHSQLHTTIAKDGLENFTFELLEEVPKDRLGEREKYWIDFYDTKKYGLNERAGG